MQRLLHRLFVVLSFGLIHWANNPRMLQLEIKRPILYNLMTVPPLVILFGVYTVLVLRLAGAINL